MTHRWGCSVDIPGGDGGGLFDDRLDDRAHSRNTAVYKTLAETVIDALDDSGTMMHVWFEEKRHGLVKAGKEGHIKVRILASCESPVFLDTPPDGATRSPILITGSCSRCG